MAILHYTVQRGKCINLVPPSTWFLLLHLSKKKNKKRTISHKSTESDTSLEALLIVPLLQVDGNNPFTQMDNAKAFSSKNNKCNPKVDYLKRLYLS